MKAPAALWLAAVLALLAGGCTPAHSPAPVYTISPAEEEEAPAPAAAAAAPPQKYRVQKGDKLIDIAMHYDLDYHELARWNNIRDPDVIQVGQLLQLTPPANDPVASAVPQQGTSGVRRAGTAAAAADGSATPVRRETTMIGGAQPADPAAASAAAGAAPYKEGPQATQYAYSPKLLKQLQKEWRSRPQSAAAAAAPAKIAKPGASAPAVAAAAPAAPAPAAASADAPAKTRQKYGVTWSLPVRGAVLQKFSTQSKGIAFGGARGNPVFAAADGEVIYVGTGVKSYGRLVILRHKNDYLTAYAHNEKILVQEGQRIARGSPIATMGSSGSERVQLHFEVRKGGKPVNPAQVLPQ